MNVKRKGSKGAGAVLFGTEWSLLILQFTALAAVTILLTVLGWIGYTMLTAPREEEKQG
jgi:hypothetical protein